MAKVIHFDLLADDPKRAVEFYSKTFGWQFTEWDGPLEYWLIYTGPDEEEGIHGGLSKRKDQAFANNLTIRVDDAEASAELIEKNGGTIVREKAPIPGVGWLIYFKDTEGNQFGILEADEAAQ